MEDKKELSIMKKVSKLSHMAVDGMLEGMQKSNPALKRPYGVQNPATMRHTWGTDLERNYADYGYKPKLTLLTDQHKLLMYLKDPIISSIVQTRISQICQFSVPQKDKYDSGFVWEKIDDSPLTDEDKETIKMLNNFILNTGIVDDEREEADELLSFETFLKLCVKDALIYDTLTAEIVPDKTGKVHHWLPVSAASMRLTAKNLSTADAHDDELFGGLEKPIDPQFLRDGKYKYTQVVKGQMKKVYTNKEIIMEFRNPINDLFTNGYPVGELDLLMNTVSAHLNAENYNRSIFTNGLTSAGIINLKGEVDDEQLKAMRRAWYSQGVGIDAMFKTPIVNTPDGMEFIKLDATHKDIEYSQYIEYLIKVMCAVYQIAPDEIGFTTSGRSGAQGNSQNYNNVEKKVKYSMDKGLKPLLKFVASIINDKIMPKFSKELNQQFRFKFVGLNVEDRIIEVDRLSKEGRIYKTVNDVRREMGMQPIPGADFILDPTYMEWYMQMSEAGQAFQQQQNEMMQGMEGGEELPPEDGGDEGGVNYVDENGSPINPEDIDPDTMQFEDEDGRPVDSQGNPIEEEEPELGQIEELLPFEAETETLPFESEPEDSKKLPFET